MLAKMQNNDTNVNDSSLQKHVLRGMDPSKKDFNKEEAVLECKSYVHKLSQEACKGRPDRHNYATNCTCLRFLQNEDAMGDLEGTAA
mmetsp:Transcript_4184/g.6456  ORF Transcript_4184/g.6456 Transcript_4184/m.6456 type:complete len:87 (+) Transcript_4184:27-287(+)